jgi:hypothetical protein
MVKMIMFYVWVMIPCRLKSTNISEKHAVSICKAEVAVLGSSVFKNDQRKGKLGGMGQSESRNEKMTHFPALSLQL